MSKAQLVIAAVVVEGRSKSEVARDYDVSRYWVQQLVKRYETEGPAAFEPRSRKPHHHPNAVDHDVEEKIVLLRKTLTKADYDAGAATIAEHLNRDPDIPKAPAVSTIWRVLSRRGFVTPQPHKRPRSSWIRFEAEQPNQRWQADVTHWHTADGTTVEILDIIDDHSRVAIASHARTITTGPDVVDTFLAAIATWGTPAGLLTDNGAIFTARQRGHGRTTLGSSWASSASATTTAAPITRRPAARSNASTRPTRDTCAPNPPQKPWPTYKPSSTPSPATTTPNDPTAPCADALHNRPTTADPRRSPPATRSPRTTACAPTVSTKAARSPSATTAGYTTSDCPNTCVEPKSRY